MRGKRINSQQGFTLLELILTLTLLTIVLGCAYTFYFVGLNFYQGGSCQIDLQQNARIAMNKMGSELKFALHYSIESPGDKITFYIPGDYRRHEFRLWGRDLEYRIGTGVTKVAYNVDSLVFSPGENGTVEFAITVKDQGRDYSLTSSVKPRNIKE